MTLTVSEIIDHVELSSDRDHDKDYYDGLLDVTHGCFGITLSYNILHDHWKSSLVGHSDSNGAEDVAIRVTYHHNYWYNLNSRLPSFRFGQGLVILIINYHLRPLIIFIQIAIFTTTTS